MKNKKTVIISTIVLAVLIVIFIIFYCVKHVKNNNVVDIVKVSTELNIEFSDEELNGTYSETNAEIILSDEEILITGEGAEASNEEITITKGGYYYITGTSSNANIVISANKESNVTLVLDNCNLKSLDTAPINGISCKTLTITSADGSKNSISDSETYTKFSNKDNSEPDATIFSKTDLVINGSGTLTVNSNYQDAIATKDSLKIAKVTLNVTSKDDGIRGKDFVAIKEANITINAEANGIKSTNTDDAGFGFIKIEGGIFNITSVKDGIQAETIVNISENPELNITTTQEQSSKSAETLGQPQGNMKGMFSNQENSANNEDTISSKGIKAGNEITIVDGIFNITTTDDAIHTNGIIIIEDGTFSISSGDDGIHADTNIIINNGIINITKCYEGIESSYIEINDGIITIEATDDGINIAGGNDNSGFQNGPISNFSNVEDNNLQLVISGGEITVNASGDGLDSNGAIYINGGKVFVNGPTSDGDAIIDFQTQFIVNGGDIIGYGSSGMLENPSNSSKQNVLIFSASGKEGDVIKIIDSKGDEISSFKANKNYSAVIISNSNIIIGETYTLFINDTESSNLDVTDVITSNVKTSMGIPQNGGGRQQKGEMTPARGDMNKQRGQ